METCKLYPCLSIWFLPTGNNSGRQGGKSWCSIPSALPGGGCIWVGYNRYNFCPISPEPVSSSPAEIPAPARQYPAPPSPPPLNLQRLSLRSWGPFSGCWGTPSTAISLLSRVWWAHFLALGHSEPTPSPLFQLQSCRLSIALSPFVFSGLQYFSLLKCWCGFSLHKKAVTGALQNWPWSKDERHWKNVSNDSITWILYRRKRSVVIWTTGFEVPQSKIASWLSYLLGCETNNFEHLFSYS